MCGLGVGLGVKWEKINWLKCLNCAETIHQTGVNHITVVRRRNTTGSVRKGENKSACAKEQLYRDVVSQKYILMGGNSRCYRGIDRMIFNKANILKRG